VCDHRIAVWPRCGAAGCIPLPENIRTASSGTSDSATCSGDDACSLWGGHCTVCARYYLEVTAKLRVRCQFSLCTMCGGQSGTGTSVCPLQGSCASTIPTLLYALLRLSTADQKDKRSKPGKLSTRLLLQVSAENWTAKCCHFAFLRAWKHIWRRAYVTGSAFHLFTEKEKACSQRNAINGCLVRAVERAA
jgi:hypothetical protein